MSKEMRQRLGRASVHSPRTRDVQIRNIRNALKILNNNITQIYIKHINDVVIIVSNRGEACGHG